MIMEFLQEMAQQPYVQAIGAYLVIASLAVGALRIKMNSPSSSDSIKRYSTKTDGS